jgi:hypothetical protein
MFFKLKQKTLALNFFLILLVLSMGYNSDMRSGINSASATSPTIVSQIRGDTYSDAALSDGNHMWTGGLEPYIQASNGTYVPYILSQNSTHYIIDNKQAPFIINKNNCITSIYDNSVPLSKSSIHNKQRVVGCQLSYYCILIIHQHGLVLNIVYDISYNKFQRNIC